MKILLLVYFIAVLVYLLGFILYILKTGKHRIDFQFINNLPLNIKINYLFIFWLRNISKSKIVKYIQA